MDQVVRNKQESCPATASKTKPIDAPKVTTAVCIKNCPKSFSLLINSNLRHQKKFRNTYVMQSKGPSLYYVRVFQGFFEPPTHLHKDIFTT